MSVFDHVYYPFHHDHINTPVNTPLIIPFELQMVGGVSHENWGGGVITPWGVWINPCLCVFVSRITEKVAEEF